MADYIEHVLPEFPGDSPLIPLDAGVGGPRDIHVVPQSQINEAIYLFLTASLGCILNLVVVCCIIAHKRLRRMTSAFIVHGCALDLVKCIYCFPFAMSLLRDRPPDYCATLGGTYVIIVTASGFNIVAMVCCEAYTFSEHNTGGAGKGSLSCVVFGLVMVYIGSVIIHLGPTIIGGDFNYNQPIGNCLFLYGTIKSYVVHSMWIVIMTLAMTGALYYLVFFYRYVQANSTHRLAALVRASIQISRGDANDHNSSVQKMVRSSLSRARVLFAITALYITFWYPLFILTLADPKFKHPSKVYKLLTFLAWSNAAVNPLVYIFFDRNITLLRQCACARRCIETDEERSLMANDTFVSPGSGNRSRSLSRASSMHRQVGAAVNPGLFYERVGSRLFHDGPHPVAAASPRRAENCNGGVNRPRRLSMCEIHQV